MDDKKKLERLLGTSQNGVVLTRHLVSEGIHRGTLRKFVDSGKLEQVRRGVYLRSDVWEDELYLLQQQYSKGVFSHETALRLLGYSDRIPQLSSMTFPQGYHCMSMENKLKIHRVMPKNFGIGIVEVKTSFGNMVRVYEIERTLCDILRGKGIDIQLTVPAFQKYAQDPKRNINKLMEYAQFLRVEKKVNSYMRVLL